MVDSSGRGHSFLDSMAAHLTFGLLVGLAVLADACFPGLSNYIFPTLCVGAMIGAAVVLFRRKGDADE